MSRFASAGQVEQSQTAPAPQRLTIEELQAIDVTSVAKHAEPAFEAPAAISIIRQDDLRRAGITTLPEALRLAAGVEVARFDGHTWSISARGFDISTANKMVVLIDGRSVYTPLFSGVLWDAQDLVLEDIDRIEVIRGPGSALWGANAMNGVINVITKRAADTKGRLVSAGGGSKLGQTAVRYGGGLGANTDYRVYAKYRYLGAQVFADGTSARDPLRTGQVGGRLDREVGHVSFTLQGDAYLGRVGLSDRADSDIGGGNLLGRLTQTDAAGRQLQMQAYYDATSRVVPQQFSERRDTADVQLQYRLSFGSRHDVTAGAGLNLSRSRTTPSAVLSFDPATRTTPLFDVFGQDVIAVVPQRLFLTLGAKAEHNAYTGAEYQPTVRLRWSPSSSRTIWGEVSRAVRMPTRFDTDLRFTGFSPIVLVTGSAAFRSETVVAGELGYRQAISRTLAFSLAAFRNRYDRLRSEEPTPPTGLPVVLANLLMARTAGVEVSAEYHPIPRWEWHANYSFLSERFSLKPGSLDPTGGTSEANDPAHQFSVRSFLTLPGRTELDATLRVVGRLPHPAIPRYAELTLHWGVHPSRALEIALIGDNLLHPHHQEFSGLALREEFVRSVFLQATWQF